MYIGSKNMPDVGLDKPARLIIRLFFGFASDDLLNSKEISANTETAMLSLLDPSHTHTQGMKQSGSFQFSKDCSQL